MTDFLSHRPEAREYPTAVAGYLNKVPSGDLLKILTAQVADLAGLVEHLDDAQALAHHEPYTWSIKQVVGHLADCERVFGYRCMRIARADATPLPGFDENAYMEAINFDRLPLADLATEFELERRAHVLMLKSLGPEAWMRQGVVNGHPMSARAVACVMAGHAQHHLDILHQRLQA